ncbi:MAG TPA: cytochrome c peroxidase [Polyangiaceae bacterium]|nr:cytochrome c peroxidase [Polyangiaceae bacterium]
MRSSLLSLLSSLALALACRGEEAGDARRSAAPSASAAPAAGCAPLNPAEGVRGAFIGNRFGPLALVERTAEGEETPLSTDALRGACDGSGPRLLVVRLDAPWCATCAASIERYGAVIAAFGGDVTSLDVVFSGADNGPTTPQDLAAFRAAHASLPGRVTRAADAEPGVLLRFQRVSPAVFLVEPSSMRILDVVGNPTSDNLYGRIERALSSLGRAVPAAARTPAPLVDGRFSPEDWAVLQAMRSGGAPPPDPSNAHADDPAAAALGRALFSDSELGGRRTVGCVTCHAPDHGFSDGRPTARGAGASDVNTLGLGPAAYNRWWFWDGRADSLWAQATGPLENAREMDGTRLGVAHHIAKRYRAAYERVFGPLPELANATRFPLAGKPGDAAWNAMAKIDRDATTRVFVNAAKALAAFERTLRPRASRLDAYLGGDARALSDRERDGMKVFLDAGCAVCHGGPMLTDGAFHDIHMPSSSLAGPAFPGRIEGVRKLLAGEFRADGPYSDAPEAGARLATLAPGAEMLAQIKTPSLRDVALTGPWGHGGTFKTLAAVVDHYDMEELTDSGPTRIGTLDPAATAFAPTAEQRDVLVAFLMAVGGG